MQEAFLQIKKKTKVKISLFYYQMVAIDIIQQPYLKTNIIINLR